MDYRINFFYTVLQEIEDSITERIKHNALAHRASKSEQKDFEDFMKDKDAPLIIDHEAQIKQAQGK